ncbi:MAG TPA: class I SAM-dependent methyltransferase [Myxococcaceae bacterium]|nr:class I SAM-dependent methyltransferase [Myxococcaceae bacterium]
MVLSSERKPERGGSASDIGPVLRLSDRINQYLTEIDESFVRSLGSSLLPFPRDPEKRRQAMDAQLKAIEGTGEVLSQYLDQAYFELNELDTALSEEDRKACLTYHRARVHPFFFQVPFVRRAFDRPLGYPGDYLLVEMIFDHRDDGVSAFARSLSRYTLNVGPACAHRARSPWIGDQLSALATRLGRPPKVLSFACGPERCLRDYLALGHSAEITLADFDAFALEHAAKQLRRAAETRKISVPVTTVRISAFELIRDPATRKPLDEITQSGRFDLIVVAGLLDYLSATVSKRLIAVLREYLAPDGAMLLTNLHARNPWRAFMLYVGDWDCLHRTREQLEELVDDQPVRFKTVVTRTDETETNLFLRAEAAG